MTKLSEIPLVVIGGPTAVGKTQLSIELAKRFNGEIINGDRLQLYRGLDIGTGKATVEERQGIPHYLLDTLDWHENYDASQFKAEATQLIQAIWAKGKLPILVGGSGLYLEGLLYHLEFGGEGSQADDMRQLLQQRLVQEGAEVLWQELATQDPDAAAKIPVQNERRIVRALEMMALTGKKFSEQVRHEQQQSVFHECLLVLNRPRQALYERINQRVELMIAQGLEQEVRALYDGVQTLDLNQIQSTQGIGYKEWFPYFAGEDITQQQVMEAIQQNSRRYAKRQLTWFRNRTRQAHWLDATDFDQAVAHASAQVQLLLQDLARKEG